MKLQKLLYPLLIAGTITPVICTTSCNKKQPSTTTGPIKFNKQLAWSFVKTQQFMGGYSSLIGNIDFSGICDQITTQLSSLLTIYGISSITLDSNQLKTYFQNGFNDFLQTLTDLGNFLSNLSYDGGCDSMQDLDIAYAYLHLTHDNNTAFNNFIKDKANYDKELLNSLWNIGYSASDINETVQNMKTLTIVGEHGIVNLLMDYILTYISNDAALNNIIHTVNPETKRPNAIVLLETCLSLPFVKTLIQEVGLSDYNNSVASNKYTDVLGVTNPKTSAPTLDYSTSTTVWNNIHTAAQNGRLVLFFSGVTLQDEDSIGHVALYYRNASDETVNLVDGTSTLTRAEEIIESSEAGVQIGAVDSASLSNITAIYSIDVGNNLQNILNYALSQRGAQYNIPAFMLRGDYDIYNSDPYCPSFFCSELVWTSVFKSSGMDINDYDDSQTDPANPGCSPRNILRWCEINHDLATPIQTS